MKSINQNAAAPGTARYGRRSISGFRFHHMLVRFSRDVDLLDRLAKVELDAPATRDGVEFIVQQLRLEMPLLELSRRRRHADGSPTGTGLTMWSVADLVEMYGPQQVDAWEAAGALDRHLPDQRIVRLGDPTLLVSAAHELAHVLVAERSPRSPSHGKVFVSALDDSARVAAAWLRERHPEVAASPVR
jgi:hypothetical protein